MRVSDMRGLRTLYTQKHHLLTLSWRKSSSSPTCICCKFPQNPKISRQLHSSQYRKSSLESTEAASGYSVDVSNSWSGSSKDGASVGTFYDPMSGRIKTKRDYNNNNRVRATEYNGGNQSNVDNGSSTVEQRDEAGTRVSEHETGRDAGGTRVYGEEIGSGRRKGKGKGKSKTAWVCSNCGYSDGQWWGYCKSCNAMGSMKQFSLAPVGGGKVTGFEISENLVRSWLPKKSEDVVPIRLTDVKRGFNLLNWRIPLSGLFGAEVGRVFGGGLVPGSLVLVGGDPGVGKSTLLLKTAAIIAEGDGGTAGPVIYISGEESIEQIGNRADRMRIGTTELFLYSSTDIEDILEKAKTLSPQALVVDSIQTVYLKGVAGSTGSLTQPRPFSGFTSCVSFEVRECTSALLRFAKATNTPVLLAGHVTKSGDIAGPRVLEHIVDVVLYLEGEKSSSHRLLRAVKNRFGSTDEVGVFEMSPSGLQAVSNPSEMFLSEDLSDSEVLAGLAVAVIMDGARAFLIEIQALCLAGSSMQRQVNGVQASRADMIIAVLTKQAGLKLQENGIFLNVVSGFNLSETAGDLSIAAAICSSFLEYPIPRGVAFIGEVGLAGEVRTVPTMEKRVSTLAQLGYRKCIVPKFSETYLSALDLGDLQIVGCRNLKEMINAVFRVG